MRHSYAIPGYGWERVREYLQEDPVMMSLIMESVVISFTIGGIVGALVTMHLAHPKKVAVKLPKQSGEEALEP